MFSRNNTTNCWLHHCYYSACVYHRDGYNITTIVIILTALSAMTFLQNEVRCIWCESGRNCCGEKREGQSANDYLLIIIFILSQITVL